MWTWLILGLLALWLLVAFVVRSLVGSRRTKGEPDPLALLDLRLARGEITAEEYRRLRRIHTIGH